MGTSVPRERSLSWDALNLPTLPAASLDNPFTAREVWEAINDSPAEKAPGPDGFNGIFYRRCWGIIRPEIMAFFQHVYNLAGGDFVSLNSAFVCLLPKAAGASRISDFRPISLIHSVAKLFAKVLAQRLSPVIGRMISPAQSAFLKTRTLHDNYVYVRNTARALHRRKKASLLLKLDFAKAFDSVSWEYLLELLQHLGFSTHWRDWIALLLSSASSEILLNGSNGKPIRHRRGLRQGDPLSPLLFILALDPLQRILQLATSAGVLSQLPVREDKLRTSLYEDDAVLFLNPVRTEVYQCSSMKCILNLPLIVP
ncbi:hypothetical protein ACQ4PT_068511 [Festuca glaucescens]